MSSFNNNLKLLKKTQPYVKYISGYTKCFDNAIFYDKDYGEFKGRFISVCWGKRVHPLRSTHSKDPISLNFRLKKKQPHLTYVSGFQNVRSICKFIDEIHGEFEGQWICIYLGKKLHPKKSRQSEYVKSVEGRNFRLKQKQPHLTYVSGYIDKKSICTFIDSEYGEFEGQWDTIYAGNRMHPKRSRYYTNVDILNQRLKEVRPELTYISGYKNVNSKCIFIDEIHGEFESRWDSIFYDNAMHPNRRFNNTNIEIAMCEILDSLNLTYIREKYIGDYRVDFYLREHGLIIECDSLYFHSSFNNPDIYYHQNKLKYLNRHGYNLLGFYCNEIFNKPEAIKSIIIGSIKQKNKYYDLKIKKVKKDHIIDFLSKYSLQNLRFSGYAAYKNNEIIAYLKVKESKNFIHIKELCAKPDFYNSNTLSVFLKNFNNKKIIYCTDNRLNNKFIFCELINKIKENRLNHIYTNFKNYSLTPKLTYNNVIYGYGLSKIQF